MVYSLDDYVYAHENMGHVESIATRRLDPRAKPIEQLRAETGEVVKVQQRCTCGLSLLLCCCSVVGVPLIDDG